jgi:site-specific recombinase XerC
VIEGRTLEIFVAHARTLLASIGGSGVVARRDRALLAILVYTTSRAGAVAALQRAHFYRAGDQYLLHFREKGGKSREIPVRHDLQEMIFAYLDAAACAMHRRIRPCFRARCGKRSGSRERPSTSTMCAA